MEISQVAISQWKQLCKDHVNTHPSIVDLKVEKAVVLGQVKHIYRNGNRIIRYHDLNLLVSNNEVQTIWRDSTTPTVNVSEKLKEAYERVDLIY